MTGINDRRLDRRAADCNKVALVAAGWWFDLMNSITGLGRRLVALSVSAAVVVNRRFRGKVIVH